MDAAGGAPAARVSAATIKGFAESLGVPNLPDDVAAAQAADVEYRLRQIIQASSAAGAPAARHATAASRRGHVQRREIRAQRARC
jgi:hypothetical protein